MDKNKENIKDIFQEISFIKSFVVYPQKSKNKIVNLVNRLFKPIHSFIFLFGYVVFYEILTICLIYSNISKY